MDQSWERTFGHVTIRSRQLFKWSLKSRLIDDVKNTIERSKEAIWKAIRKHLPRHTLQNVRLDQPLRVREGFKDAHGDLSIGNILKIKSAFNGMVFVPIDKSPGEVLVC